ncbi:hypothetical protein [Burkholderia ubonensis]|uniref:hypothetical protein n=1 Tax=Burkholderia ubonensis TaxID=101571 RepID=UPI000F57321B|nr:hypothetical protein [Burkholderia ubonensis]
MIMLVTARVSRPGGTTVLGELRIEPRVQRGDDARLVRPVADFAAVRHVAIPDRQLTGLPARSTARPAMSVAWICSGSRKSGTAKRWAINARKGGLARSDSLL